MPSPESLVSASMHYRSFGQSRPPVSELQKIIARSQEPNSAPIDALVGAQASIDFAVHRAGSTSYIEKARELLDRTRSKAKRHSNSLTSKTGIWVEAVLFEGQLDGWAAAGKGRDVAIDYETLLKSSMEALRIIQSRKAQNRMTAEAKLVEFLPLVLGGRSYDRYGTGWNGRLALLREDSMILPDPEGLKTYNPNWDTGICLPDTGTSFLQPMPVQIKQTRGRLRETAASAAAGVRVIHAVSCGFADPTQIILSCANEIEPVAAPEGVGLLHGEQLDFVTSLLESKLRAPLETPEAIWEDRITNR